MPDEHEQVTDSHEPVSASRPRSGAPTSPLITAVEIENFKGIGRPMRVELRPITLLFGNNSAGKSTVLHALCYAHEILSHGNVDAHTTDLGGDQVDLGGFRNLVHARDLDREVRLRFELNLIGRDLSAPLRGTTEQAMLDGDLRTQWVEELPHLDPPSAESGWLELAVARQSDAHPILLGYEVGANKELVGRIDATERASVGVELLPNLAHPLLSSSRLGALSTAPGPNPLTYVPVDYFVGERLVSGADTKDVRDNRFRLPQQTSSMPRWDRLLGIASFRNGHPHFPYFRYELSVLLVGIGAIVRDELALLRHLGPLRDMSIPNDVDSKRPATRRWANGSAAWDRLNDDAKRCTPKLVPEASEWLSHKDRLDTGYGLRLRTMAELPGQDPLVAKLLSSGPESSESPAEVVREATSDAIEHLATTIAEALVHKEVELAAIRNGLPLRPSDIGVGISQILPVVVAALDPRRPELTAIEQPELHLHPRIQVELGDLFASQAAKGGSFLIETHSEHLLLRFMKRMRQTCDGTLDDGDPSLRPEDIAVYFVEIDPKGDQTLIREMPLNERGDLVEAWPGGFFEEDLREIF